MVLARSFRPWLFHCIIGERRSTLKGSLRWSGGFTLIELVIVIVIIGVLFSALAVRTGAVGVYQQRGFLQEFRGTLEHLHYQAISDRSFYAIEFDFQNQSFRAGVVRSELDEFEEEEFARRTSELGIVSTELNSFLNPSLGTDFALIPPPSFQSLFDERVAPPGTQVLSIRTPRGLFTSDDNEQVMIFFSPRGFSEFASIVVRLRSGLVQTWRVNPFTGRVEIFEGERDFDFSFDSGEKLVELGV